MLPYLRRIDEARVYANFGPLATELEHRLAAHLGAPPDGVVSAVNGTAALTAALLAATGGDPGYCLMPSWTFPATAHAALGANLTPLFVDVDRNGWRLDPDLAGWALGRWEGVRAVLPVAAFGMPLDPDAWDRFGQATGCPVVIDAAAGFAAQKVGLSPVMISLHATKVLGAGEGALIATQDPLAARRIRQAANFGFPGRRLVQSRGINGKMSEYGAAVALAALDAWPEAEARWRDVARRYRQALAGLPLIRPEPELVSSTLVCELPVAAEPVRDRLAAAGVDTRQWYNRGCHLEPAFEAFPRGDLAATEALGRLCLGLPMFLDITDRQIARVAAALGEAVGAGLHDGP